VRQNPPPAGLNRRSGRWVGLDPLEAPLASFFEDDESLEYWDMVCPFCGNNCSESGRCPHLLSTEPFSPDGGEWAGDYRLIDRLRTAVESVMRVYSDGSVRGVKGFLRRSLPARLHEFVLESCDNSWFASSEAHAYLYRLIGRSAGLVYCSDHEAGGCGSTSSWTATWTENAQGCAWEVDLQLAEDARTIRQVAVDLARFVKAAPRKQKQG
jgi:hypothetical protein